GRCVRLPVGSGAAGERAGGRPPRRPRGPLELAVSRVPRRSFLQSCAAAATFSLVKGVVAMKQKPHVVVVGAGAFGGWTALYLTRRGARVTLVDAWGPGNSRASSGGEGRVIRAT